MFHNQNDGTKHLRDNRALFAAENAGASRTKDDDEDENESKLRSLDLMDYHAEVGYPSQLQHSTPRRQALRLPAIEKVGRNAS